MGVIGGLLPIAIGVAISVMPIVAAVVLMTSVGGTRKAWAFTSGYFVAVLGLTLLIAIVGQQADTGNGDGSGSGVRSGIQLLLGVGLLFLSYRNFRNRNIAADKRQRTTGRRSIGRGSGFRRRWQGLRHCKRR